MKKSLIALAALSAFATAAQAQSSVTVYGLLDFGYASSKTDFTDAGGSGSVNQLASASFKNVDNSGINAITPGATASSRIGLRGSEDLGGGLAANFNVEWALAGNGTLNVTTARTSTVGLSSKTMGTVNIGRQLTGIHGIVAGYNPLAGSNMVGDILYSGAFRAHGQGNLNANLIDPAAATTDGRDSVRMDNGVSYVSPTFNGLSARVDLAQDKRNADTATAGAETSTKHQGLSVNYAKGPIRAAVGTHTAKTDTAASGAPSGTELKIDAVSAEYRLNPALALQASYAKAEWTTNGAINNETTGYRLGASYGVGKWVLAAQYGTGDVSSPLANSSTDGLAGRATAADRTAMQLAAFYSLSKRTALYAAYGTQEQKVTANTIDSPSTTTAGDALAIGDKRKDTQMAIGIRHSF
jgi:predicted porin